MSKLLIHKTARKVRKEIESISRYSDLACMCAIASAKLFKVLNENKIEAKLAVCHYPDGGHCFLVFNDHIIDITATQFSKHNKPIEIVPIKMVNNIEYWDLKDAKIFTDLNSFVKFLKRNSWDDEQIPYNL
jgi:hypothetical protein